MKIAIVGYGAQGASSYAYWRREGNEITICDQKPIAEPPADALLKIGDDHLANLDQFDLIVRAPIVHPSKLVAANSPAILAKVTSNTNEFFRVSPTKNIIGVTGTKGKGTTSTLLTRILESAGKKVHLGGNIGIPPLDLLKNNIAADDWVVLELANFQLIDLRYSPPIAVCVMVEPEHQDWHADVAEYYNAKKKLFAAQQATDVAIYYAKNENSTAIAAASSGVKVPYFAEPGCAVNGDSVVIAGQEICKTSELKLLGEHNWQNVCAAITAVWQVTQDVDAIRTAVINFSGLPFRIEFRTEKNGVRYYNDSFATAPGATIAAIHAIKEPKVLIAGGFERGLDLTLLAQEIAAPANGVKAVLLIGVTAERTAETLRSIGFSNYTVSTARTMPEIVTAATVLARSGDAVVLSPAFASFDMFKNFEERGKQFNAAVEAL